MPAPRRLLSPLGPALADPPAEEPGAKPEQPDQSPAPEPDEPRPQPRPEPGRRTPTPAEIWPPHRRPRNPRQPRSA